MVFCSSFEKNQWIHRLSVTGPHFIGPEQWFPNPAHFQHLLGFFPLSLEVRMGPMTALGMNLEPIHLALTTLSSTILIELQILGNGRERVHFWSCPAFISNCTVQLLWAKQISHEEWSLLVYMHVFSDMAEYLRGSDRPLSLFITMCVVTTSVTLIVFKERFSCWESTSCECVLGPWLPS